MENDGGIYPSAENPNISYYEVFSTMGASLAINYWKIGGIQNALSCNLCNVPGKNCGVSGLADCKNTIVLKLSSSTNAHAEKPTQANYPCAIECSGPFDFSIDSNCSSDSKNLILKMSADTNAHVGGASSSYSNNLCLERPSGQATCRLVSGDCDKKTDKKTGETCVATISGKDNAHIARCDGSTAYSNKICCTTLK
jgi:hypothetical protein